MQAVPTEESLPEWIEVLENEQVLPDGIGTVYKGGVGVGVTEVVSQMRQGLLLNADILPPCTFALCVHSLGRTRGP